MTAQRDQSNRQVAIIRAPLFGVGDYGHVCLRFQTYVTESSAALQILDVDQAVEMLKAYGLDDVHKLEGKPCWVDVEANRISYAGPWA